jgi:hypothetical protein
MVWLNKPWISLRSRISRGAICSSVVPELRRSSSPEHHFCGDSEAALMYCTVVQKGLPWPSLDSGEDCIVKEVQGKVSFDSQNDKYASQLSCDASPEAYLSLRVTVNHICHLVNEI